ncbi:MAG TPA: hypothetical protein VKY92_10870 [Verrucomicrobiae bacterium]|nr:hypothetical protein [Verrucomicrobiae bacterium]
MGVQHVSGWTYNTSSARIVGVIGLALMGLGLVCGILALVESCRGQRASILARVIPGVAVTGLLLAVAVPNYVRGRNLAVRNRRIASPAQTSDQEFKAQAEEYSRKIASERVLGTNVEQVQVKPITSSEVVLVDSENQARSQELLLAVTPLIQGERFDELESLADRLRKSKECTASGTWHLALFYDALTRLDGQPDDLWIARLDFCRKWAAKRPNSITAQVTLASFMINYAWEARGHGYASTVSDQGWQLFDSRLKMCQQILDNARSLPSKCPVWWSSQLRVALGQGWSRRSYDKVFNEAVAFEPCYTSYYVSKAIYLLPRWHGQEGDWQRFAAASADQLGGEAGDVLYARIGWSIHELRIYNDFRRESGYSETRLWRGLNAIVRQFPQSISAASEFAYLLSQAGQFEQARPLFLRLDRTQERSVWGRDTNRFASMRNFVTGAMPAGSPGALANISPWAVPLKSATALPARPSPPSQSESPKPAPSLVLKGISGSPAHRLAIINNETFAKGDTAKLKVDGTLVKVTCLDIRERSVVVTVGEAGQPTEIAF